MRPLRYSINVTLDGVVDHWAVDPDEAVHRHAMHQLERADALLFGRVTYELMEDAWRPPVSDDFPAWTLPFARVIDAVPKHVVSRTLTSVDWNAELVEGDLESAVRALKEQPGDGIYVGGVSLPTALAGWGLIDEYELLVHPRVVGPGRRLLEGLETPLDLELVGRADVGSGAVALTYVPR